MKKQSASKKKFGKDFIVETKPGYFYVRIRGKYFPLNAKPGTAEFDRQYWEILSGKNTVSKTSWQAMIESYKGSIRWADLKPRTRADYERVMTYLIEKNGPKDATRIIRKDVIAAMEANRHRVRFANEIANVMKVLFDHACDIGWMRDNPARGVRKLPIPKDRQKPHDPWPDWAVKKWRAEADGMPALIFEVGVGSVQRPADWCEFTWADYDGENLRITQGKTGRALVLPCSDALKAVLDAEKRRITPHPSRHILTTRAGGKLTYRHLSKIMHDERRRLGLLAYDLHALRYRGVQELAWAGCTDDQIMSYSGHSTKDMVAKYAGEARQIMLARAAKKMRDGG